MATHPATTDASPSSKELDVSEEDLLPDVLGKKWSSSTMIVSTQQRHQITTDHQSFLGDHRLYTDVADKIVLPPNDPITKMVIALCHSGDLHHRSARSTVQEFRQYYYLHGLKHGEEDKHILCRYSN